MQEKKKVSSSSAVNAVGTYSLGEEIANAVTHGLAVLLSIAGLVLMIIFAVRQSAGALAIVSTSIFGASMIILYTVSTLYHAIPNLRAKRVLQVLDHSAIYILIAGSYTPFCLITLGGTTGIVLCSVVWTIALFGACFQPLLLSAADWLNCVLYLALGWCIVNRFRRAVFGFWQRAASLIRSASSSICGRSSPITMPSGMCLCWRGPCCSSLQCFFM